MAPSLWSIRRLPARALTRMTQPGKALADHGSTFMAEAPTTVGSFRVRSGNKGHALGRPSLSSDIARGHLFPLVTQLAADLQSGQVVCVTLCWRQVP